MKTAIMQTADGLAVVRLSREDIDDLQLFMEPFVWERLSKAYEKFPEHISVCIPLADYVRMFTRI